MAIHASTEPGSSLLAAEISQQPVVWPTTLERIRSFQALGSIDPSKIVFTGAGTSAYAGAVVSEAWSAASAIPTTDLLVQSPDQIIAKLPFLRDGGYLVSLARSGDSPESAAVVEKFQRRFPAVRHLAIVCNANGCLAKLPGVEAICLDPRTNDRSLAMTGSFSNLVLSGLALFAEKELTQALPAICSRVEASLIDLDSTTHQIARACKDRVVVLATQMQALCREAALKIIELTAGHVMAMPETFLGFRHGAIGFLREETPILCFLSNDPSTRRYEEDVIEDLRAKRLGRLVIIGETKAPIRTQDWSIAANAPELRDGLRTPFEIPVAQLLAYHLSLASQVDPDNPSPDGTITRVVRPFRIHSENDSKTSSETNLM